MCNYTCMDLNKYTYPLDTSKDDQYTSVWYSLVARAHYPTVWQSDNRLALGSRAFWLGITVPPSLQTISLPLIKLLP